MLSRLLRAGILAGALSSMLLVVGGCDDEASSDSDASTGKDGGNMENDAGDDAGDDAGKDASSGGGNTCEDLCSGAGFSGGDEQQFDNGDLVECTCSGTGAGIEQDDCSSYCDQFGVGPDKSYLSTENADDDKCVCDGTTPPV